MSLSLQFKRLSSIFSFTVALVGLLVLIGWAGDISVLKSISPRWISMKANAAICFLLAGSILILVNNGKKSTVKKGGIAVFSVIIFLIGAVTVLEYIFKFDAGIDELFFKDSTNALLHLPPGRQSPFSAAYFMLFGFCYFPGIYEQIRLSLFQMLHIFSGIFVLASGMSYVFGPYIIGGVSLNFIFVIHSTVSFLLLILAVLFSQPEAGYMKLVSSNTIGGKIIRKTLPLFLFIFIIIGWLGLRGEEAGLFNKVFSISFLIILMIIIFGVILFSGATSLANSEDKIKTYNEQLRLLTANLQNIREEERQRIGREIHDELGQLLTVLKMDIAQVKKNKGDDKRIDESVNGILKQIDQCILLSRRISSDLRPTIIDDLGLIAALEWQAEEFGKRANIRSVFKTDINELNLPPDYTIAIFRIFQESLTNIARHADATAVTSSLYIYKGKLVLNIADNGRGFDTATIGSKKTLGLVGIKERILLMNGSYDINSSPGMGTEIIVVIPVRAG
jgi:signal transduction histidine kinase